MKSVVRLLIRDMKVAVLLLFLLLPPQILVAPESIRQNLELYQRWYNETAACAGLEGDFSKITWQVLEGSGWYDDDGSFILGKWYWPHTIFLPSEYVDSMFLVKHEMLHDLRQEGGHPTPPFNFCEHQIP